jgi:DnaJ-class molecular chaperone
MTTRNSWYFGATEDRNAMVPEIPCTTCRGRGYDHDGADCIDCEGYGSIIPLTA